MSNNGTNGMVGNALKALLITAFKLLGIGLMFTLRLAALILNKLSEIIEKLVGHGKGH